MPEPTPQIEQELAAAPIAASPAAVGAAPMGAFSAPMAASVRAFSSGRAGLPSGFGVGQVSALQRSAGNQAVARLVGAAAVHRPPARAAPAAGMAPPAPAPPGAGPAGPSAAPAGPRPPPPRRRTRRRPRTRRAASTGTSSGRANARTSSAPFLEVARLYPGWGLLAGGAADLMNAKQDFTAIQGEDAPEIKAFMAGRHAVAILNNGVGHVIYVDQLVQDIATASVVGAEVDAITIPLNEVLLTVKVGARQRPVPARLRPHLRREVPLDEGPARPDRRRRHARPGTAWSPTTRRTCVGDLVGGVFDVIDLSSAGFSNSQPVRQGARAVKGVFDTAKLVKGLIKSRAPGLVRRLGRQGVRARRARSAASTALAGACRPARIILHELQVMKAMYTVGDMMIGGGRRAHRQAAHRAQPGGDDRARRPGPVHHRARRRGRGPRPRRAADRRPRPDAGARDHGARRRPTAIETLVRPTRAARSTRCTVPNIELPEVDIGDDALADLAEGALNMAGDLAGAGAAAARRSAQRGRSTRSSAMLTRARSTTIKDHADRPRRVPADRHRRGARADRLDAGAGGEIKGEAREVQQHRGRRQPDHPADLRDGRAGDGLRDRRHPPALGGRRRR